VKVLSLVKMAVMLAVMVLMQEYAIRLAVPDFNPANHLQFTEHVSGLTFGRPGVSHRHIKNTGDFNVRVRFNELGLREDGRLQELGPKDFVVVGDSYGFGWGVDEKDRASEVLSSLTGRRFFNASTPAGAVSHYIRMIELLRSKRVPARRVLVAFSFETDFILYDQERDLGSPSKPAAFNLQALKELLIRHSAAYFAATSLVQQTPWLRTPFESLGLIRPVDLVAKRKAPDETLISQTLSRLKALAGMAETTVMVIPPRGLWTGNARSAMSAAYERFVRLAQAGSIDIVDLRPAFEATSHPLALHFEHDAHWRPEGHALAAKVVARHLADRYGNAF